MDTLIKDLRIALPRATSTSDFAKMDRSASREELFELDSPHSDSSDDTVIRSPASKSSSLSSSSPRSSRSPSPGIDRHHTINMKLQSSTRAVGSVLRRGREMHRQRKHAVDNKSICSPAIYVEGEMVLSEGPLPAFVLATTLEEALHELPRPPRLAVVKSIIAWRMGHLEASWILDVLRSFGASGGAALRSLLAQSPISPVECEVATPEQMSELSAMF